MDGCKITDDDFRLFDVPARFEQDRSELDARWKALQSQVHPDNFAADGAAAQRLAMQWAVRVNEAYQRLKQPLTRAAYLCTLNGQQLGIESNTAMPAEFLIQQMTWREALEDARGVGEVESLGAQVAQRAHQLQLLLQDLIDVQHDWAAAAEQVRALMFIERFAQDIERRIDALDPA